MIYTNANALLIISLHPFRTKARYIMSYWSQICNPCKLNHLRKTATHIKAQGYVKHRIDASCAYFLWYLSSD